MNHNKHTALVWYGLKVDGELIAAKHFPFFPLVIDFGVKLSLEQIDHRSEVVRVAAPVELKRD